MVQKAKTNHFFSLTVVSDSD